MSDEKPRQEGTTEEILASIRRRIVSGGEGSGMSGSDGKSTASGPAPEPGHAPSAGDAAAHQDVLDLTEVVRDPGAPEGATPAEEPLVSAATAALATETFGALAKALGREPEAIRHIPLGQGRSLEDLVREMIRPMLREWLDRNLPPMVERLVGKEIQRMVRRAEDQ
ncbi:MAG TPA: DUF2497 domain-containing protein [Alphaproteobacteria bacterium]